MSNRQRLSTITCLGKESHVSSIRQKISLLKINCRVIMHKKLILKTNRWHSNKEILDCSLMLGEIRKQYIHNNAYSFKKII